MKRMVVCIIAGSSPSAQQRAIAGGITCTSSSSSEMAQLDDVCLSPGTTNATNCTTVSAVAFTVMIIN